jgi:hypothetical protein
MGDISAVRMPLSAIALDHHAVPVTWSGAIACVKYVEYTKVTTSVEYAEFAQSYKAHDQTMRGASRTTGAEAELSIVRTGRG